MYKESNKSWEVLEQSIKNDIATLEKEQAGASSPCIGTSIQIETLKKVLTEMERISNTQY